MLGFLHDGAINVNKKYTKVDFDLHASGGQGGIINELWEMRKEFLKCFNMVLVHSFRFLCGGDGGLMLLVRAM